MSGKLTIRSLLAVAGMAFSLAGLVGCETDPALMTGAGTGTGGSTGGGTGTGGGGSPTFGGDGGIIWPDAGDATTQPTVGTGGDNTNCGITMHSLSRLPPDVLLVLDRSGSMAELPTTPPTRWDDVTAVLKPALEQTQAGINWGLKLFAEDDFCTVKDGVQVPIAASNAAKIISTYSGLPPKKYVGYTPTREAVLRAGAYMKTLTSPNPKFIVLATDGEPNCAPLVYNKDTSGKSDAMAAIQAVATVAGTGIPIYVVGVATASQKDADLTLNQMAMNGLRPRNDPVTKYYAANNREELIAAFNNISAQLVSCTFALDKDPPVPDNVAVELDGKRLMRDPAHVNGWDYGANMKTIQFYGQSCTDAQKGTIGKVQILFGCPRMPIP